jgi:predicted permease
MKPDDLPEELAAHLDELTEELVLSGLSPEDARDEARRRFGNQTALLERSRAVWRVPWLDALVRDVRFSWRLARRQPWTMAAAIASIAIGVGANTAVTGVVDAVLLNPLGVRNSDRIVAATVHITKLQMKGSDTSGAEFQDLQLSSGAFSAVAATEGRDWTLGGTEPARVRGLAVTREFFQVFGVPVVPPTVDAVILSDGIWRSRFGGSAAVVGTKILLNGRPYQVTGIAPPDFHFPASAEAWIALDLPPDRFTRGNNMNLSLYARLNDGVSVEAAQQHVDHELLKLKGRPEGLSISELGYGLDVEPLAKRVAGDLRLPVLFLWLAAAVLLLAACANVAGLLMARAGSRRKEMAIRLAVGAGKLQILRQLLTESLILALLGGAAGMALASFLLGVLKRQPLPFQNILALARLDYRLLVYGMALALVSSLLFGLAPAIELLREQHTGALARARRKWFQNIYIVGQVSAAMLLLVVMGLLLKSLQAVELLRPGFDARNLTTALLIKPAQNQGSFYNALLEGLRRSPGVESAALAYAVPFAGDGPATSMFAIKSHHHRPGEPEWHGQAYQVTPDYLATLRIPLLRGRFIQDRDTAKVPHICVIDEGLAQRFFPDEEPIGQQIAMYGGWATIVGVAGSVRDQSVESTSRPTVYYSLAQIPYFPQIGVVVRSSILAAGIIRNAVANANPQVPVFDVQTMAERIDASEATRSVMSFLVTVFAGISILLAAIGIHGVVAQVVTEHTAEIGIRMAVGARAGDIFRRYAVEGLQLSLAGVVIGLTVAGGCSGVLRGFLYAVQPLDPAVMVMGGLGVLLVSGAAVFGPAWRAARVDPQIALRSE